MQRLKVMTVVGTRPEIIRLSRVMARLDEHAEHIIVHTGQNYDHDLNEVFFSQLGLRKPDYFLGAAGATAAETIGKVIIEVDKLLEQVAPEAMLILGDTNSCLAALPAKRRKIPIFHMEAGNRCFDFRVPEEINRRIVDHVADVNLTYSSIARDYLLREGLSPDRVIKTGSPMFEVIDHYRTGIQASKAHAELGLEPRRYVLISAHREENVDSAENARRLVSLLNAVADRFCLPVIMSTHPRTRKRIEDFRLTCHPLVRLMKPFGFLDYVKLQTEAMVVLSDSGTITEESSILNFPAINIRETHERPEGFEEASVMMTGFNIERTLQAIEILHTQPRSEQRLLRPVADYAVPNVSHKVVRIIVSYVDYVNRVVWRRLPTGVPG